MTHATELAFELGPNGPPSPEAATPSLQSECFVDGGGDSAGPHSMPVRPPAPGLSLGPTGCEKAARELGDKEVQWLGGGGME